MRFEKFTFENFRGIKSAALSLSQTHNAVNVLVGLNESGKTTILEAIDNFSSNPDLRQRNPDERRRTSEDYQAMIPIGLRSNFDGKIVITAHLRIGDDEFTQLQANIANALEYKECLFGKAFTIEHTLQYEASKYKSLINLWSTTFKVRNRGGKTAYKTITAHNDKEKWLKGIRILEAALPKVMYFPTHLLDFPERIILEKTVDKKIGPVPAKDTFYYAVLEDILKAVDKRLSVEAHILKRLKSNDRADQQNLESLLQKAEQHLNATILGEWRSIFGASFQGKRFRLSAKLAEGGCYAEIKLADGASLFSLNERSAGFRWFFAFSLLVKYRAHRSDQVLFLFDEPAANLHPKAQAQLLDSFATLSAQHQFIYTTHSHYLVNPQWLESTHIVKNDALDSADAESVFDLDPTSTSISVTKYRTFVGSHPDQQFYYKPVMDALEYSPSRIAPTQTSILVEGKTDYYCLEYFKAVIFPKQFSVRLFPGGGCGSLDPLISLLSGWGVSFLILLDGDAAATKEQKRYETKFESLVKDRIYSLTQMVNVSGVTNLEKLFSSEDREMLRATFYPEQTRLTKTLLHQVVQECLIGKRHLTFSKFCLDNFRKALESLQSKYDSLEQKRVLLKAA